MAAVVSVAGMHLPRLGFPVRHCVRARIIRFITAAWRRGYDIDWFRDALNAKGIELCMPTRGLHNKPAKYDNGRYHRPTPSCEPPPLQRFRMPPLISSFGVLAARSSTPSSFAPYLTPRSSLARRPGQSPLGISARSGLAGRFECDKLQDNSDALIAHC